MRATIKKDEYGYVYLKYMHPITEEIIEYTFYCPADGGYVRYTPDGKQICERLSVNGPTLICDKRDNLIDLIRSEYKKMMREYKKIIDRIY